MYKITNLYELLCAKQCGIFALPMRLLAFIAGMFYSMCCDLYHG